MQKYLSIIALLILWSCSYKDKAKLDGKIENASDVSKVFLYEQLVSGSKLLDSSKLSGKGEFNFKVKTREPRFYLLRVGKSGIVNLLLSPGEKVKISADASSLDKTIAFNGSPGSELVRVLNQKHQNTLLHLDSLRNEYKILKDQSASPEKLSVLEKDYLDSKLAHRKDVIRFVIENYKSLASIMALYLKYDSSEYVLEYPKDLQYYKIVSDSLIKLYPASRHVKALKADFDKMLSIQKSDLAQTLIRNYQSSIPEIALPNAKGDTIKITKFLGKIILLSFWSYESKAALMLNRDYLDLYRKYSKSGLLIYQVSIDNDKNKWLSAIKELPWISVSEITSGKSYYASLYNLSEIPSSFLIDQKGNIAGKNLIGKDLDHTIAGLLKK